ncbi:MAG: hypothetical protein FWC34_08390 [Bacteroidetes bacterium]|nr:hypothetical protein [Bacteroidota bacterium]MCL2302421.1 hypothetical protein [Lentimicrobiaceae bacterium]
MKKLMMLLAIAGLIFVSCGGTKTEQAVEVIEETCALTPEQTAMFENWENWENLTLEERETLVSEMKAFLDACKAKCEEKKECGEKKEMCPEKEAKCAEYKAKWEAFEELELDVKKEILDLKLQHMANKCKDKEGCCKGEKEGCCKKEGKEACGKE